MTWWIGSNARCGRGQRGRYWGAFQYVPRSKLVCTGADSNSAVRAFVGYDADALERWRTAEPRDQEREYSPFDVRVAFDGLRRHQLRSCPLNVSGKVFAEVFTMRWILTATVLAAAAIGMTIGSPSTRDALTPEQWRERAAAYFPGWTRMAAATRPNSPITDSGRC